jgi:hypothetical protein
MRVVCPRRATTRIAARVSVFPGESAGIAPTMDAHTRRLRIIVGAIPCGRPAPFVPQFPPEGRRARREHFLPSYFKQ